MGRQQQQSVDSSAARPATLELMEARARERNEAAARLRPRGKDEQSGADREARQASGREANQVLQSTVRDAEARQKDAQEELTRTPSPQGPHRLVTTTLPHSRIRNCPADPTRRGRTMVTLPWRRRRRRRRRRSERKRQKRRKRRKRRTTSLIRREQAMVPLLERWLTSTHPCEETARCCSLPHTTALKSCDSTSSLLPNPHPAGQVPTLRMCCGLALRSSWTMRLSSAGLRVVQKLVLQQWRTLRWPIAARRGKSLLLPETLSSTTTLSQGGGAGFEPVKGHLGSHWKMCAGRQSNI